MSEQTQLPQAAPDLPSGRKQSLYFPEDMLAEIEQEAKRIGRSMSWVVQRAWRRARQQIKTTPSDVDPAPDASA